MARIIKDENIQRILRNVELCKKAENKQWNYNVSDFIINNSFNFTYPTWKNTWCKGGANYDETIKIIQKYCQECKKKLSNRNFSFIHLVED